MNTVTLLSMTENVRRARDAKFHGPREAVRRAKQRVNTGEVMRVFGEDVVPPTKVYFIQQSDGGPIKIGTAKDPEQRLAALQTGNPQELRLLGSVLGSRAVELGLHELFRAYRLNGEWFAWDGLVVSVVLTLLEISPLDAVEKTLRHSCVENGQWVLPVWAPQELGRYVPGSAWGAGDRMCGLRFP